MTITEYLDTVKAHLLANAIIVNFQIKRERQTLVDGHLRARLALTDGSTLEFSEYVKQSSGQRIEIVTYILCSGRICDLFQFRKSQILPNRSIATTGPMQRTA